MDHSDGVLSDESGSLIVKPCTEREVDFYQSASQHPAFAKWMPTFYGTLALNDPNNPAELLNNRQTSIVLQNLTFGFAKPSVLDCKLGAQLWDEQAPQDKRDRLDKAASETTSKPLGFRIAGMKVYKSAKDGYNVYDKLYGRTFTPENVIEGMKEFFTADLPEERRKMLTKRFLDRVTAVREMLESHESRMISASLLFVYEGDADALEEALKAEEAAKAKAPKDEDDDSEEEEETQKVEDLKLIDFAHAGFVPGQGPDENALHGVRSVEKLLAEIVG